jgi:hypothetical protein
MHIKKLDRNIIKFCSSLFLALKKAQLVTTKERKKLHFDYFLCNVIENVKLTEQLKFFTLKF